MFGFAFLWQNDETAFGRKRKVLMLGYRL